MDASLIMQSKGSDPKVFALPSHVTVIGRRRNCDLRIPLESVSRRHCQLNYEDTSLKLRDLGSRNGTFLNGKKLSDDEQTLQAGDRIRIGPIEFVLQIDGNPKQTNDVTQSGRTESSDNTAQSSRQGATGADELDDDLDLDLDASGGLEDFDLDLDDLNDL